MHDRFELSPEDRWVFQTIEHWKREMEQIRPQWKRYADSYRSDAYEPSRNETPSVASAGDQVNRREDEVLVEANYLFAFVDSLIANVCPPTPEVTVKARRRALEPAAKLRQELVNDFFRRENVAAKMWKLAGRACIYPRAWLKVTWSQRRKMPKVRVINPHYVFFDVLAEEQEDMRYVCEMTVLTRQEFMRRVRKKVSNRWRGYYKMDEDQLGSVNFAQYPEHLRGDRSQTLTPTTETHDVYQWVTVYEFYDLVGRKVYHVVDGMEKPVYCDDLPYQLLPNPFFLLTFNDNLEDIGGLSDAKLVHPTLMRLNELSSLRLRFLHTAIPIPVIHEGLVDDAEDFLDQYEDIDGPGQALRLSAPPRTQISDVLGQTPTPQLPIEWESEVRQLVEIIEFVLGLPSFARGQTGGSDVATDLALADNAIRTRNSKRQKALYNVLVWAAKAIISLFIEFLPSDTTLPIRFSEEGDDVEVSRQSLAFPKPGPDGLFDHEDPWSYDYTAMVFNGDEDNRIVRLKAMVEAYPNFVGNPDVNQRRLTRNYLELLRMLDALNSPEDADAQKKAQADAQAQEMGATPKAADPAQGAGDATPDAALAALSGGQVMAGNGAQGQPAPI